MNAYERQLDTPSPKQEEAEGLFTYTFLPALGEFEEGIEILRGGSDKGAAYRCLIAGDTKAFEETLFGRTADERGLPEDPLFVALGLRRHHTPSGKVPSVGLVQECLWANQCFQVLKCSVGFDFSYYLNDGFRLDGGTRIFTHWTYESLFQAPPPYYMGSNWPPSRTYPDALPPAPPINGNDAGEFRSGEEVQIDGIYEPWFFTGRVGCPNYLLKGSIAHQYQPEGSNDLDDVRWRLIWEDKRYLDGKVPPEEAVYLDARDMERMPDLLHARAGDTCPQSGDWRAPRLSNRIEHVERGQKMPGPIATETGSVVWHLIAS